MAHWPGLEPGTYWSDALTTAPVRPLDSLGKRKLVMVSIGKHKLVMVSVENTNLLWFMWKTQLGKRTCYGFS